MKDFFLAVVEISISTSFIILILLMFSPYLSRRYAAKWKYLIWIAIAVRLIIPFNFRLPVQKLVVDVPAQIASSINVDTGKETAILLQVDHRNTQMTLLDIAAFLWLAGCILFLSVHIFSFWHFKKQVIRDGEAVEDEKILRQLCSLSGELCIKPDIRVVRYPDAGSPMMIGFFKPVLVLPGCDYNEEELFFILKHELIHLKRHDIFFKLLFVACGGLHWFNPLVYVMQKEAVIDMELSCDERVIWQTPYAVRKAYTETLLSTLGRQYKKERTLTTQFYGGKKVMEKRFKNILMQSKKRNGAIISIVAVGLTLVSGMLVGCSMADTIPSGEKARARLRAERPEAAVESQQDIPVTTDTENGQAVSVIADTGNGPENAKKDEDAEISESGLSVDGEEIKELAEKFAAAYFSGDERAVKRLLPDSYAWDIEAYEGTGKISDITLKGLPDAADQEIFLNHTHTHCVQWVPDAGEQEIGSILTVSMQYRDSTYEDMFQYLTLELIKQDAGWEIQFYGLEG